jgi:hypothetical protein
MGCIWVGCAGNQCGRSIDNPRQYARLVVGADPATLTVGIHRRMRLDMECLNSALHDGPDLATILTR